MSWHGHDEFAAYAASRDWNLYPDIVYDSETDQCSERLVVIRVGDPHLLIVPIPDAVLSGGLEEWVGFVDGCDQRWDSWRE